MENLRTDSRRSFLRNSGAALLAGYAFSNRTGLAQTVARPDAARYQSVVINTHDYHPDGEIQERLDFPKDWVIDTVGTAGAKAIPLTSAQILQKLRSPIGSKSLGDIAAGKKNACITFDDASRPTNFALVAEQVINELNAAGIDDQHILFIGATGSHDDMHAVVARQKLGAAVYSRCPWLPHQPLDNSVKVGRTSWNNMIEVNGYFAKSDVKILMGSIRTHAGYVFGGGPKGIIPGITSVETIYYNHAVVGGINRGNRSFEGDQRAQDPSSVVELLEKMQGGTYNRRADALEASRLAAVDFSINIVQNQTRQVIDLYCGDVNEAHLAACVPANDMQCYDHAVKAGENDIVIVNSYPTSMVPPGFGSPREGGISIVILQSPVAGEFHKLHEHGQWDLQAWQTTRINAGRVANYRRIYLSQYVGKMQYLNTANQEIYPTWDKILPILEQNMKTGAKVLLYPSNGNMWNKVAPRAAAAPGAGGATGAAGAARQGGAAGGAAGAAGGARQGGGQ